MSDAKPKGGLSKLAQMKAGVRLMKVVKWPGTDTDVGLLVPTELDYERARLDSWGFIATKHGISPDMMRGGILYDREVFTRLLASVLVDPASGSLYVPMVSDVEDLKKHTTQEERSVLVQELSDWVNEMDPDVDTEEGQRAADEICDEIEKKRPGRAAMELLLNGTQPRTLRRCVITMANRWFASLEDRSSHSSTSGATSS